ncbi:hypothetical protein hmeg3_07450 [Herbaspirillum sp. meg3]|uniref:hypothetical protein n=1 Tax=Herbaspirillum sp. meg3 TaxID=2025949 RepID=UPI000B991F20|nr:hypothetical protein [Herbaspirillum sp. meg3]ASU38151.1 hypothetical protein hmeg3_07450 [Herbaspirillum sp. meg3]
MNQQNDKREAKERPRHYGYGGARKAPPVVPIAHLMLFNVLTSILQKESSRKYKQEDIALIAGYADPQLRCFYKLNLSSTKIFVSPSRFSSNCDRAIEAVSLPSAKRYFENLKDIFLKISYATNSDFWPNIREEYSEKISGVDDIKPLDAYHFLINILNSLIDQKEDLVCELNAVLQDYCRLMYGEDPGSMSFRIPAKTSVFDISPDFVGTKKSVVKKLREAANDPDTKMLGKIEEGSLGQSVRERRQQHHVDVFVEKLRDTSAMDKVLEDSFGQSVIEWREHLRAQHVDLIARIARFMKLKVLLQKEKNIPGGNSDFLDSLEQLFLAVDNMAI